jgi:hypothetical protein
MGAPDNWPPFRFECRVSGRRRSFFDAEKPFADRSLIGRALAIARGKMMGKRRSKNTIAESKIEARQA